MSATSAGAAAPPRVLVIGYGNPSRGDDGLGPALAERLEALARPGVTVESDYQLSIEHAALAAAHDVVIFADAAAGTTTPFSLTPLSPADELRFTTHAVTPAQVLGLAGSCFGAAPDAFVLAIRASALGGFHEGLSPDARAALDLAVGHVAGFIDRLTRETDDAGR